MLTTMSKNTITIFLCDLIHDYVRSTESYYVVPLNIGFISAYCQQQLGSSVSIRLFKFPHKLEAALEEQFPDIIGFSFYTWNEELVHHFASKIKRTSPRTLVVFGGPNIETTDNGFSNFFKRRITSKINLGSFFRY